jgi:hypothetical protein
VVALVLAPVVFLILPLRVFLAELPLAVGRSLFSRTRSIEAVCRYPQEMRITWRVDDPRQLDAGFERIVERLAQGYDGLELEGTRIVDMTRPAGLAP